MVQSWWDRVVGMLEILESDGEKQSQSNLIIIIS